jgi:hypothetical protein
MLAFQLSRVSFPRSTKFGSTWVSRMDWVNLAAGLQKGSGTVTTSPLRVLDACVCT